MKPFRRIKSHKILCNLLRELRIKAGLNQAQVAALLQRPQSYVSKYESGERRLDLIELQEICGAVGLPLRELIEKFEKKTHEA